MVEVHLGEDRILVAFGLHPVLVFKPFKIIRCTIIPAKEKTSSKKSLKSKITMIFMPVMSVCKTSDHDCMSARSSDQVHREHCDAGLSMSGMRKMSVYTCEVMTVMSSELLPDVSPKS